MATLREIRRRIRSVQSTAKITKAMELVAASKMRRAQQRALASRPYAERLTWVLADLAETVPLMDAEALHPLLRRREVQKIGIVHMTPLKVLSRRSTGKMSSSSSAESPSGPLINRSIGTMAFALINCSPQLENNWVIVGG